MVTDLSKLKRKLPTNKYQSARPILQGSDFVMKKFFSCLLILFGGCTVAYAEPSLLEQSKEDWVYTTRQGDTLWGLSKKYLDSPSKWRKLKKYNNIINHKTMPPGTRLRVPVKWMKNQASPAFVEVVTGDVEFTTHSQRTPQRLTINTNLSFGSVVTTGERSSVTLRFADESRLFILQNSQVHLDSLSAFKKNGMVDTRLRLQKGRVRSSVIPFKNNKSRYEITTPAAVASVRGTDFRVSMNLQSETMFSEVLTGKVSVGSEGITRIVHAGFGTSAIKGRPPEPVRKLLDSPNLSEIPNNIRTRPLMFTWKKLKHAESYRVQFAQSLRFKKIFFDTIVSNAEAQWHFSELGTYAIRVRGVDRAGLEGKESTRVFTIANQISPPELVFPLQNKQLGLEEVVFQWRAHSDTHRYLLQVSRSPEFKKIIIETSGNQMHYTSRKILSEGTYYWRVANEYAPGVTGKFSNANRFEISAMLAE